MSWEEYTSIRDEMISLNEIKHNYIMGMTTICVAIMGIGIQQENVYLLLMNYIVLFSFQSTILRQHRSMQRLSAVLAVYGQDEWEKKYKERNKLFCEAEDEIASRRKITNKYVRIQSIQLAVINVLVSIALTGIEFYGLYTTCSIINLIDVIFVLFPACFSVMLMLLFKWWCKGELKRHNLRDSYIAMLQNNMALV